MTLSTLILLRTPEMQEGNDSNAVPDMIHLLRLHLGMDIAFVSEFSERTRDIKLVDTDEPDCKLCAGICTPSEETYCRLIVDGKLPELMPDVRDFPIAAALRVTEELGIGSYVAAPIRLADGTIYGTFCCYSHGAEPTLNRRDLAMMHVCADMTARQIDKVRQATRQHQELQEMLRPILSGERISILYQPIYDLREGKVVGFEALSRFGGSPQSSPDQLFKQARAVGMGVELEAKAVELGLQALPYLSPDIYISVNVSPATILSPVLHELFRHVPAERVTLEITEHEVIEQYQELEAALRPIRDNGVKLAVDDAGAGYASFRHILQLAPDRIKVDCSLTKHIDTDPARRALIAAFVRFSQDTDTKLIAEGVETATELQALQDLGVAKAQGFLLSRPLPLAQAAALLRH